MPNKSLHLTAGARGAPQYPRLTAEAAGKLQRSMDEMRTLLLCFALCLFGCADRPEDASQDSGPTDEVPEVSQNIAIIYKGAGLTTIRVSNEKLIHTWHTLKPGLKVVPQTIDSYDKHEFKTALTESQHRTFKQWIKKHELFSLPRSHPPEDAGSYGAAFLHSLYFELGEIKNSTTWTSASGKKAQPAVNAITELKEICDAIRDEAEKKSIQQSN